MVPDEPGLVMNNVSTVSESDITRPGIANMRELSRHQISRVVVSEGCKPGSLYDKGRI